MSGGRRFQPACRPLLRGGLPHPDPTVAVQFVCQAMPQTPAWVLPAQRTVAENPFALAAQGLPGAQIDLERDQLTVAREALERDAARVGLAYLRGEIEFATPAEPVLAVLAELLRQLNSAAQPPLLVKYEIIGPVSLCLALTDDHDRPLAYEPEWREVLLNLVSLRAAWQHQQVQGYTAYRLAVIDEPFLDALSSPLSPLTWEDGIELLSRLLADLPALRGLTVSGAAQWDDILRLPIEAVFFHLTEHLAPLLVAAPILADFLAAGGCLGWGIVPVDAQSLATARADELAARMMQAMQQVADATGIDTATVHRQSFLTPTGSLMYLSPAQAEQALALCAETARVVRRAAGLMTE